MKLKLQKKLAGIAYKRVVDGICEMLHRTGLFHGYSYNTWSDVVQYTDEFVDNWLSFTADQYVLLAPGDAEYTS